MPEEPKIVDELKKMDYEPLLPAESALIIGSLTVGIVLLLTFMLFTRAGH